MQRRQRGEIEPTARMLTSPSMKAVHTLTTAPSPQNNAAVAYTFGKKHDVIHNVFLLIVRLEVSTVVG